MVWSEQFTRLVFSMADSRQSVNAHGLSLGSVGGSLFAYTSSFVSLSSRYLTVNDHDSSVEHG